MGCVVHRFGNIKGNPGGQRLTANRTIESFFINGRAEDGFRYSVIPLRVHIHCCLKPVGTYLPPKPGEIQAIENHGYHTMAQRSCLPRIKVIRPKNRILLHPTCSCQIMGLTRCCSILPVNVPGSYIT